MSGSVGSQLAGRPAAAALLSAFSVGRPFLEGCALGDEPDSAASVHPASTKTNKVAASAHPNRISLSRAAMVAPTLLLTVRVSYGNQRIGHRVTIPTIPANRPDARSSMPSTCPYRGVRTSRFELLLHLLGPSGRRVLVRRLYRHLRWICESSGERGSGSSTAQRGESWPAVYDGNGEGSSCGCLALSIILVLGWAGAAPKHRVASRLLGVPVIGSIH